MRSDLQGMDLASHLHPYTNFADLAQHGATIPSATVRRRAAPLEL